MLSCIDFSQILTDLRLFISELHLGRFTIVTYSGPAAIKFSWFFFFRILVILDGIDGGGQF